MSSSFEFESVDRFTTGAVGPRGARVFYLQIRAGSDLISLRLEKQQVAALADYLAQLTEDLPPSDATDQPADLPLEQPAMAEWVVGSLGVAYAAEHDELVLLVQERENDEDPTVDGEVRMRLTRGQVDAFIMIAQEVVSAGRPPCRFCSAPVNHEDGWCACSN